ncbi:hypothetical protein SAMN05216299_13315 [Nitrosospira sp. Nsp14]|uniref:hypothetical protein n=1 Tax=Nitrosospira sp. Nsp14 TaxID=1855333 RepID=UPI0008E929C1|nr:hypothetical protein [Nitrosospira sp. Nsp14]SFH60773.1 hypothetical protein SAMN05216299_13315 [Nitrosospira sp. Nsp14]
MPKKPRCYLKYRQKFELFPPGMQQTNLGERLRDKNQEKEIMFKVLAMPEPETSQCCGLLWTVRSRSLEVFALPFIEYRRGRDSVALIKWPAGLLPFSTDAASIPEDLTPANNIA